MDRKSWLLPGAGAVTSDLCDITLLTHQVLHGRDEFFRKVRQPAEGGANLCLSVWMTVDWQLLHRTDELLQVSHMIWHREAMLVQEVTCVSVCMRVCVCLCVPCPDVYLALAAFFIFCSTNRSLSRTWTNTHAHSHKSSQYVNLLNVCVCVCVCLCLCAFALQCVIFTYFPLY